MRYIKDSVVINPQRDLPLLRQVRNSRFVTHQQLFEFMQLVGTDDRRNSFNWRTKRLLRSGHLSVCDGRFGTGAAIYRISKSGLALLEHHGEFTTVLHSNTEHLPHAAQVFHSLELNAVHLALAQKRLLAGWLSEIEIASFNIISRSRYQKDYDAVVEVWNGDRKVCFALEYERSLKSSKQYQKVREALDAEREVECVLYLTSGIEILVHLVHEFESVRAKMAFAESREFSQSLLDTAVITTQHVRRVTFRDLLH